MNIWIFFAGLVILEIVADVFAKKFGMEHKSKFFIISLLFYMVANASWLVSMHYGMQIWKGVVIFGISQAIAGVIVGVCMGETINNVQWAGVAIGIVSIVMILIEYK